MAIDEGILLEVNAQMKKAVPLLANLLLLNGYELNEWA